MCMCLKVKNSMSSKERPREEKLARWWFGGTASACAAAVTHPLDLLKVHLQIQESQGINRGMMSIGRDIVEKEGVLALWNGMSAAILRQMTYAVIRFGLYETGKNILNPQTFWERVQIAVFAGTVAGFLGTPPDVVNVRMQNDVGQPPEKRRNYKHAFDGLYRLVTEDGIRQSFNGGTLGSIRCAVLCVGQLATYDQIKQYLIRSGYFGDNLKLHITTGILTGMVATTVTQPLDILKTRMMSAEPGKYRGILHVAICTGKKGPMGFYRGAVPAFLRSAPMSVLTFLFLEQLRLNFGYFPKEEKPKDINFVFDP